MDRDGSATKRPTPSMIAIDWGTSSFRAYLLSGQGEVLDRLAADKGIMAVTEGGFEAVLNAAIAPWWGGQNGLSWAAPILACGMIGSRQGWREAPYGVCPGGLADLAKGLVRQPFGQGQVLHIVPGICRAGANSPPDVMRGEECQILGLDADRQEQLAIMPGSHCKWVRFGGGRIEDFATFMTGEVFAALRQATILGRLMPAADAATDAAADAVVAEDAFAKGVGLALDAGPAAGGLLHQIFAARTLGLFDQIPPAGLADFLSGLLIGTEIRDGLARFAPASGPSSALELVLVGGDALCARYGKALALAGWGSSAAPADVAARGLYRVALAANLLPEEARS